MFACEVVQNIQVADWLVVRAFADAGVEDVNIDTAGSKLTVTGKVDPVKLRQRLEDKTHKRVELVSPQPKKDGGASGDKKPEEKKKAADKNPVEVCNK